MSDFRHLDVDQYDDETLSAEELAPQDPRSAQELNQLAQAKQSDVRARISSGDTAGALHAALADPPTGAHALQARQTTLALVMDILNSTRTTDITPALKALSMDERDTLMKYLYRGMEMGRLPSAPAPINCAVLLSWHDKVCIRLEYMGGRTDKRARASMCGSSDVRSGDTLSSRITRMIVLGGSYAGRISSSTHFAHFDTFYVFLAHYRHMRMRANSFSLPAHTGRRNRLHYACHD